jgi:hypothetical protein
MDTAAVYQIGDLIDLSFLICFLRETPGDAKFVRGKHSNRNWKAGQSSVIGRRPQRSDWSTAK